MSFDAVTKNLTVNPGLGDFGSYILDVSFSSDYDGFDPSTLVKTKSHAITIYRLEIGSGKITN